MAERLGDAILELRTSDRGFDRGIDSAERRARALGRTFDNVGRKAQRLGGQLSLFVTAPIIAMGVATVKTASDVQEMQNLFDVTFEDAAGSVEEWARRTADANNRSRFEFMRTASDFAAFLKPLGVAPQSIVPMSKALTQLTTDLSSFRNVAEEEVFTRLFSGLAGETEAVRRLGIDIGQAAIEQELLALGINKSVTEATQAEKVMARFSLIMRQTADAQGDAVRTAESFENQARGLGATIKDIRVEIGQRFLPAAQRIVSRLRELGQAFLQLPANVQSGIVAITAFVAIIGPAIFALGLLMRAIGFAIGGFAFLPKVLRGLFVAIRTTLIAIQVAVVGFLAFFSTIPGLILVSLAAVVGGFFIFKDTVIGFFKGLIVAIKDAFVAGFNNRVVIPFQNLLNSFILSLRTSFGLQFDLIGVNDVIENSFPEDMKRVISDAVASGKQEMEDFKTTAQSALGAVKNAFGGVKDAIGGILPDLDVADVSLDNIGSKFDKLLRDFSAVQEQLAATGEAAKKGAQDGVQAFDEFGTRVRSTIENNMTDALTRVRSIGDAIRAILRDIAAALIRSRIVGPIVDALPIPGLAGGGTIPAGQPAFVGEEGIELAIPERNTRIIPNDALAGLGGMTQNFNFPLVFPAELEAHIRNVATPVARDTAVQTLRTREGRI